MRGAWTCSLSRSRPPPKARPAAGAATAGLNDVIGRAKAAGAPRADFVLEEAVLFLMANAGVVNATKGHAPKAWERFAAYMLDALRAPGASPLPKPASPARLARAIRRSPGRR